MAPLPFLTLDQINEPSIDRFAVQCRAKDGELYLAERDGLDSEDCIVDDICSDQVSNVIAVFAFNIADRSSRDISEDIARAVLGKVMDDYGDVPDHVRPFLEDHLGIAAVHSTEREVA